MSTYAATRVGVAAGAFEMQSLLALVHRLPGVEAAGRPSGYTFKENGKIR